MTTSSIRYIRHTGRGNTVNNSTHFVEIKALDANGVNVAAGKAVTGNFTPQDGQSFGMIVDGVTNPNAFVDSFDVSPAIVTVDLGALYNVASVYFLHYVDGSRSYSTKTEVSADNATWYTIYDTLVDGAYVEDNAGKTVNAPFIPIVAPSAPTNVTATVTGNGAASIAFTAPASDGGSAITGYTATASTGQTATGTTSPIVFSGLTNDVARTFTVTATNAAGTSSASAASNSVSYTAPTDGSTVPNAPTGVVATAGDGSVSVAFTPPANNGGKPITGYKVTASTGQTATGSASPIVVSSLPNGTLVSFTVTAINALGESSSSTPSATVAPAKAGDSTVVVNGVTVLTRGIGTGKTFATLDDFGTFVNGIDLVATNQRIIGEVYNDQAPFGALRPVNSDASHDVVVRPAAGLGFASFASATAAEDYGTQGIEITCGSQQYANFSIGKGVTVTGFRINMTDGPGEACFSFRDGTGGSQQPQLVRNRILANKANSILIYAYLAPNISDNFIKRTAAVGGRIISNAWQMLFERNTVVLAAGATVSTALENTYGGTYRSNAFSGFASIFTNPGNGTSADNYSNVAQAGTVAGLTVDTANPFFVNATNDFRPGTALIGKGGANAVSLNDNIGNNRGLLPDVGAFQLTPAIPLPQGVVTSQTMDGATFLISGTTTGTPTSGKITLSPGNPANGASSVGPIDLVITPNAFSIAIDDMQPGNYNVTATTTNAGGTTVVSGTAAFEVVGMGSLVYDGGGVGTGGGGTDPAPTLPAPTVTIATADTAIMAGKRATVSGAVNLNGDPSGTVNVFLDPQPSGTPVALGAANVSASTWTKQTDIAPGLYKLRVVATSSGQSTTASTGNIRVLGLTGNFTLPTA